MKLGGTIQEIKKMTHNDNEPGPGGDYGETAVFTFCRKVDFGQKSVFIKKKNKFAKRLIFIWENGTFLSARLWLEHGVQPEVVFFGPKNSEFCPKSEWHQAPCNLIG